MPWHQNLPRWSLLINLQPRGAPLNEAPPQVTEKSTMELPLSEKDAMSMTAPQSQFCEGKDDFFYLKSTLSLFMMTLRSQHRDRGKE